MVKVISQKLFLMTLKSETKFKVKLSCGFKYDIRNLLSFHPTENFTSMSSFCPNYIRFEIKIYRRVIFHDTKQ